VGFNPADYEDVDSRLHRFYEKHPEGFIKTDLVKIADANGDRWIVKATVHRGPDDSGSDGYAFEVDGQGNVNRTSALENCETSAVGRALANAGFSPKGARPSREEMGKAWGGDPAEGASSTPGRATTEAAATSLSCPSCNGPVYDNTDDPKRGKRPIFKCKNGDCGWASWKADEFAGAVSASTPVSPPVVDAAPHTTPSKGGEPAASGNGTTAIGATAKSLGEADSATDTPVLTHAPSGEPPSTDPDDLLALASWEVIKPIARNAVLQGITEGLTTNGLVPAKVEDLAELDPVILDDIARRLKTKEAVS
jgi:hypothetical protein